MQEKLVKKNSLQIFVNYNYLCANLGESVYCFEIWGDHSPLVPPPMHIYYVSTVTTVYT